MFKLSQSGVKDRPKHNAKAAGRQKSQKNQKHVLKIKESTRIQMQTTCNQNDNERQQKMLPFGNNYKGGATFCAQVKAMGSGQ